MNCTACGYYNPPHQLTCFHCALPLPIPSGDAICAVHPVVKAQGACSRCGTFGCGDCLSSRGADWLCSKCMSLVSELPWDERESLGLWRAWWRTAVLMISSPNVSLATAAPDAALGSSVGFASLSALVGLVPTFLVGTPLLVLMQSFSPERAAVPNMALFLVLGMLVYLAITFAFTLGSMFFISGLEHATLKLLGAKPRSFTVTVRAHALAMSPYLLGVIPFCSFYVYPLWAMVLRIMALMHLHKTSAGKAAAAVILPVLLLCGGFIGLYGAVIALAMGLRH